MPPIRPATISELAAAAAEGAPSSGTNRDLKHYLRLAEGHRKAGAAHMQRATGSSANTGGGGNASPEAVGLDMEHAFIEFARAATMIVETIPTHRDYGTGLNAEQRSNLTANGQDILQNLGKLKAALVDRYERYTRSGKATEDAVPAFRAAASAVQQQALPQRKASQAIHTAAQQATADELARWRTQREEAARRDAEVGYQRPSPGDYGYKSSASGSVYASSSSSSAYASSASGSAYGGSQSSTPYGAGASTAYQAGQSQPQPQYLSSASAAAVAAAARAAAAGGPAPAAVPVTLAAASNQQSLHSQAPAQVPASFARSNTGGAGAYNYPSSAGVSFPQPSINTSGGGGQGPREGGTSYTSHSNASSPASYAPPPSNYSSASSTSYPSTSGTPSHPYTSTSPSNYSASTSTHTPYSATSSNSVHSTPAPGPMPLRPPYAASYEWESEGTDSEREGERPNTHMTISYPTPGMPHPTQHGHGQDDLSARMERLSTADGSRTRSSIDGLPTSSYSNSAVTYPALARHMSSHQRTQGYVPGAWGSSLPPAAPAFAVPQDNYAGVGAGSWQQQQGQTQANPHASMALGAARAAATAPPTSSVGYSTPLSPPPDPRAAAAQAKADAERADRERSERDERERAEETRRNGGRPRLRTVLLPHATLPRFLAIASVNTSRNLETCGLLLGREVVKGSNPDGKTRYVVETLLIPKQHATSDTCTMDEEESVLGFTEERGLITLGWIHTHPSQSCFMSSVDLHTHASFQCMLPESFAVVCAPKSDPNFGIFRLTDPPGLQTVLKCTAKQAFHPHPDVPIYTDADKGHVQMRDAALEIVDLR